MHVEPQDLPDGEYKCDEDKWVEAKVFPVESGLISIRARTFVWDGRRDVAGLRRNRLRRSDFGLVLDRSCSGMRGSMWTSAMRPTVRTSRDGGRKTGTGATRNVGRDLGYLLGRNLR